MWVIIGFIGVIILMMIVMLAGDSNKETKREKYAEATGYLARSAADKFSGLVETVVEPADKKKIRLAREALAERNGSLYRYDWYSNKEYLEKLFTVDDCFKSSLETLGLTEERWKKIAHHLFYVGTIRYLSREHFDFSKKNSEEYRRHILRDSKYIIPEESEALKKALYYFHISEDEWIKYGDTVIEMYNLNDNWDVEEYGIITKILPMKNNRHLL